MKYPALPASVIAESYALSHLEAAATFINAARSQQVLHGNAPDKAAKHLLRRQGRALANQAIEAATIARSPLATPSRRTHATAEERCTSYDLAAQGYGELIRSSPFYHRPALHIAQTAMRACELTARTRLWVSRFTTRERSDRSQDTSQ